MSELLLNVYLVMYVTVFVRSVYLSVPRASSGPNQTINNHLGPVKIAINLYPYKFIILI